MATPPPTEREPAPVEAEVQRGTPEYHWTDEDVEGADIVYSTRHPDDVVISGPLNNAPGHGRRFVTRAQAEKWGREKYGDRYRGRIHEAANSGGNRWAILVRFPKTKGETK